jgi:hypothetical protein
MFIFHSILAADSFFSVEIAALLTLSVLLVLHLILGRHLFELWHLWHHLWSPSPKPLATGHDQSLLFVFHRVPFIFICPLLPFWQTFYGHVQLCLLSFYSSVLIIDLFSILLCLSQ